MRSHGADIQTAGPVPAFEMERKGLTVKDLEPMIGKSNRVYEILNHKRSLTLLTQPCCSQAHHPASVSINEGGLPFFNQQADGLEIPGFVSGIVQTGPAVEKSELCLVTENEVEPLSQWVNVQYVADCGNDVCT